jgi:outer membrane immunogenic protein
MRSCLLATVSILAIANGANAADLAVKTAPYRPAPVPLWAGWYVGLQGGVVSHRGDFTDLSFGPATTSSTKIGATGGVDFGWLGQQGSFVYGVEADWLWVGAKAQSTFLSPFGPGTGVQTFEPNWISTVRGKAGLALDATLVYITGGVAFGHVKNSLVRSNGGGINQTYPENTTRVGWTMGFGVAHQVTPNVVVKAEGRYVDLGKREVDCTTTGNPLNCRVSTTGPAYKGEFSNSLFMGLVGVDFKF